MQEMQETWVLSLGWEDPLEEEMATHSSNLAKEERGLVAYSSWGHKESDTTEWAQCTLSRKRAADEVTEPRL